MGAPPLGGLRISGGFASQPLKGISEKRRRAMAEGSLPRRARRNQRGGHFGEPGIINSEISFPRES
jgi:hypothetical protein